MVADALATQEARASVILLLALWFHDILILVPNGWSNSVKCMMLVIIALDIEFQIPKFLIKPIISCSMLHCLL